MGGPWTVIAPAAGFAVGLAADMKLMKGMHKRSGAQAERAAEAKPEVEPGRSGVAAAPAESGSCCGVASAGGGRRAWLIGGVALAALAIFAGWDWIEANGLTPLVVLLALVPFVFMCMRGHGTRGKGKTERSLADIRRTYETGSGEPPRPS
ncbi:MAG: hypothetical protein EPO20_00980 [Betaproteobacteria bacterium]|nr:MAG: hypothetical protein EPO20_00980 [Betaproteobacteria bacterium]